MNRGESYERGCNILLAIIRDWTGEPPRFVFQPKGIALVADLTQFGGRLARNESARAIVAKGIERCMRETGCTPTSLMLEVVLQVAGVPFERVPLEELGLGEAAAAIKARRPH